MSQIAADALGLSVEKINFNWVTRNFHPRQLLVAHGQLPALVPP